MKVVIKWSAFTLVFLCSSLLLSAQETWSLEQCIKYAHDNNIQVKQQELVVEQSENTLDQSKWALAPNINTGVNYNMGWGRTLDQTTYQYVDGPRSGVGSIGLDGALTVFSGFQKRNTIKRNNIELKAAIQDVEKLKNDIAVNIAAAYLQILLEMESVTIAKEQLTTTQDQMGQMKIKVDAGSQTLTNLLELQSQAANEETQVVEAENRLNIAYLTLKQYLDLPHEAQFVIEVPEVSLGPNVINKSAMEVYEQALSLPQIKASELRLQSAEKSVDIAKAQHYPSLRLSASINTQYSDTRDRIVGLDPITNQPIYENYQFFDQLSDNRYESIGLSLSIPIFNGLQVRNNVKNMKLNKRNAELQLQYVKNQLYKEIQQADADAIGYYNRYTASEKAVSSSEEAFRFVSTRFEVGASTATEYNVAKNNLTKAQSNLVTSKYQYIFKLKILDFYRGIPLTLQDL